jgi:hypothetical protein
MNIGSYIISINIYEINVAGICIDAIKLQGAMPE